MPNSAAHDLAVAPSRLAIAPSVAEGVCAKATTIARRTIRAQPRTPKFRRRVMLLMQRNLADGEGRRKGPRCTNRERRMLCQSLRYACHAHACVSMLSKTKWLILHGFGMATRAWPWHTHEDCKVLRKGVRHMFSANDSRGWRITRPKNEPDPGLCRRPACRLSNQFSR